MDNRPRIDMSHETGTLDRLICVAAIDAGLASGITIPPRSGIVRSRGFSCGTEMTATNPAAHDILQAVMLMWEGRIQFLMACRNLSWGQAAEILMDEIRAEGE